ncbi:MAG: hypothetical protein EHM93_01795 [Bacteroidales bacterium]|nr:MAG: hypothetical protein EHM93_01795 [Bacteroidales bacterium]
MSNSPAFHSGGQGYNLNRSEDLFVAKQLVVLSCFEYKYRCRSSSARGLNDVDVRLVKFFCTNFVGQVCP